MISRNEFLNNITKLDNGCWVYKGNINKNIRPRRVSWLLFKGGIVGKRVVVFSCCDTYECINPEHLMLGTMSDQKVIQHMHGIGAMHGKKQSAKHHESLLKYNASRGKISSETRQRLRDSHKGNTSHLGFKLTDEQKLHVSQGTRIAMSDDIVREYLSLATSGENNHNWLGGATRSKYTRYFNKWIKDKIRKRDKYTCQLCGLHENGRKLAIHHVDYTKENTQCLNLISLCNECNIRVNINREYWVVYFRLLMSCEIWDDKYNGKYFLTPEDIRNINVKLGKERIKPLVPHKRKNKSSEVK